MVIRLSIRPVIQPFWFYQNPARADSFISNSHLFSSFPSVPLLLHFPNTPSNRTKTQNQIHQFNGTISFLSNILPLGVSASSMYVHTQMSKKSLPNQATSYCFGLNLNSSVRVWTWPRPYDRRSANNSQRRPRYYDDGRLLNLFCVSGPRTKTWRRPRCDERGATQGDVKPLMGDRAATARPFVRSVGRCLLLSA